MMPRKDGLFYSKYTVMACDGRCDKAWGLNGRPQLYFMEEGKPPRALEPGERPVDDDDHVYVRDSELGTAPGPGHTVGVSEGGHLKPSAVPLEDGRQMNKWCLRECERSETYEDDEPIVLRDLEHPTPNMRHRLPVVPT